MVKMIGLKGTYNRFNMFSSIANPTTDVVMSVKDRDFFKKAQNRLLMNMRTMLYLFKFRDVSSTDFFIAMFQNRAEKRNKKEDLRNIYVSSPEANFASNNMGEGYKKIGNTVMLLSRCDNYIRTGADLMPYQFIETLSLNGGRIIR